MVNWQNIKFALECTAENLFVILPVLLLSGAAALAAGWAVRGRIKNAAARLVPLILAELALFFTMVSYLVRWIGMGSFTWGFWYEGGWNFYLPFTAMLGILAGYFLGMAFWKREV